MEIKISTNKFCLNREFYLKYVFVYDEEHVKFLDCVVQVQSSWQEHSKFVLYIIPVRKKQNKNHAKHIPEATEPMDQRMSLHHQHERELTLQTVSRPILAQKKRNCHCFGILTAWCLAFPGIAHQVTYIPFVITKHV
jgi:hypothetical protein